MKTLLAVALFLAGCGARTREPAPSLGVWIDPQVDQAAALQGAMLWGELGVSVHQVAEREGADVKIEARAETACLDDHGGEAIEWLGHTNQQTLVMTVRPVCVALWKNPSLGMQVVVAHEFGHALQLGHVPDEQDALMNAGLNLNAPPYLMDADRNEFYGYWASP